MDRPFLCDVGGRGVDGALLYVVIGVVLDVVNLLVPMPDLIGTTTRTMPALIDNVETVRAARWLQIALIAAIRGWS